VDRTSFQEATDRKSQQLLRGQHGCSSTDAEEVQFYKHFKNLQKEDSLTKITKSLKKKPRIEKRISSVPNLNLEHIKDMQESIDLNPAKEAINGLLSLKD